MIRYLTQKEKIKTKSMYRENFPEDSREFVDYYYTHKTKDNQILVMEAEGLRMHDAEAVDKWPEVMIHLNPFQFQICGTQADVHYVVAVATELFVRRQGKMARVLKRALQDMAGEHEPFTFLIPANPSVYRSAGFTFVPTEQYPEYEGKLIAKDRLAPEEFLKKAARFRQDLKAAEFKAAGETADSGRKIRLRNAVEADIPAMTAFANTFLERQYDVYPYRTASYYERMREELGCQNGGLVLLELAAGHEPETAECRKEAAGGQGQQAKKTLAGIFSYGRDGDNIELQEILVLPEYREQFPALVRTWLLKNQMAETAYSGAEYSEPEPQIKAAELLNFSDRTETVLPLAVTQMDFMVRILDLQALGGMLKSREPFTLKVKVRDEIISANQGSYELCVDRTGSSIRPISPEETECEMDISKLTEFLFGRLKTFIREWV